MTRHILAVFALLLALPVAALAADEGVGATGIISQLEVNTEHADQYLQYHGKAVIKANSGSAEYRWGGTSCGSYTLTDNQVALLQGALDGGLKVSPRYRMGQGDLLCLVGFRMTP